MTPPSPSFADRVLDAPDLGAVRRLTDRADPEECRQALEPLAGRVLELCRSDLRGSMNVSRRLSQVARAADDPKSAARCEWVLGHLAFLRGRHDQALQHYDRARDLYLSAKARLPAARVELGRINVFMTTGQFERAVQSSRQARPILARHREWAVLGRLETNLGNVFNRMERSPEALACYRKASRLARKAGDTGMERTIQANLATILTNLGRFREADVLLDEVVDDSRADGDARLLAIAEINRGRLFFLRGEFGRAHDCFDSASRAAESGGLKQQHLDAQLFFGELHLEARAFRRAQGAFAQAARLARKMGQTYEEARAHLGAGLGNLGLGEETEAETELKVAAALFHGDGHRVFAALCQVHLAELEAKSGNADQSVQTLRSVLQVLRRDGARVLEALTLHRLARMELERGRRSAAKRRLEQARSLVRKLPALPTQARLHHATGLLHRARGDEGNALRSFRRAVQLVERIQSHIGIDELQVSFFEESAEMYGDLVEILLERGDRKSLADAFATLDRSRSHPFLSTMSHRSGVRDSWSDETRRDMEKLRDLRAELNRLMGKADPARPSGGGTRIHATSAAFRRQEERIAAVTHRLSRRRSRSDGWAERGLVPSQGVGLSQLQRALGEETTWVEFFLRGSSCRALVVTGDAVRSVGLAGSAAEIEESVRAFRFQIEKYNYGEYGGGTEKDNGRRRLLERGVDRHLSRIRRLVWDPLHIDTEKVCIVPHGPLHGVPFAALPLNEKERLLDRHRITLSPGVGTEFMAYRGEERTSSRKDLSVLAVSSDDGTIPAVEAEAQAVRRSFRKGVLLRGRNSTWARFETECADADVVHIATHGWLREDDPLFSSLQFADGWIGLPEILEAEMDADLVCLSACQTGRGWTHSGGQVSGLARGFLQAGARSLLVSLWSVHDEHTSVLMKKTYGRLRDGVEPALAIHRTMLELRKTEPVYHWASFTLLGGGLRLSGEREKR